MGNFPRYFRAILAATALCLAASGAAAQDAAADPVVARVNGAQIKRSDVLIAYRSLPKQTQQRATFEEMYPELLDRLITGRTLAQAGERDGLPKEADVQRRLAIMEDRVLQEVYLSRLVATIVTEDALRARYQAVLKANPGREEVSARHILVATEAQAKDAIAQLKKGADFETLAKRLSIEPSAKEQGGQLGFFSREEMAPAFSTAAFKLKAGETTETPVRTQFGWHVIRVEARRVLQPKFEDMRDKLASEMAQEVMTEAVTRLRREAKVEIVAPAAPAERR